MPLRMQLGLVYFSIEYQTTKRGRRLPVADNVHDTTTCRLIYSDKTDRLKLLPEVETQY